MATGSAFTTRASSRRPSSETGRTITSNAADSLAGFAAQNVVMSFFEAGTVADCRLNCAQWRSFTGSGVVGTVTGSGGKAVARARRQKCGGILVYSGVQIIGGLETGPVTGRPGTGNEVDAMKVGLAKPVAGSAQETLAVTMARSEEHTSEL